MALPVSSITRDASIGNRLTNLLFGGVRSIGNVLDTPGSVVRGLLAGDTERAFGGIFDPSQRVTGAELTGDEKDTLSLAGFLTEVATDPLTYLTFGGSTAAGKLASRAGKLGNKAKAIRSFADATGNAASLKRAEDTEKLLASLGPTEKLGATLGERIRKKQAYSVGIGLPFMEPYAIHGGGAIADKLGKVGGAIGKVAAPVTKPLKAKFSNRLDNPVMEELRQESLRVTREGKQAAAINADQLAEKLKGVDQDAVIASVESGATDPYLRRVIDRNELNPDPNIRNRVVSIKEGGKTLRLSDLSTLNIEHNYRPTVSVSEGQDNLLQRFDNKDRQRPFDPDIEGVYTNPTTIHSPYNYDPKTFKQSVFKIDPAAKIYNTKNNNIRDVQYISPGINAAYEFLGDAAFHWLFNLAKDPDNAQEVLGYIQTKFPDIVPVKLLQFFNAAKNSKSKFPVAEGLMEIIGAQFTKKEGYDIIRGAGDGDTTELVLLTPGAAELYTKNRPSLSPKTGALLRARLAAEETLSNTPSEVLERAKEIEATNQGFQAQARRAGAPTFDLNAPISYFSRLTTPEGLELLRKKSARKLVNEVIRGGKVLSHQMNRQQADLMIAELNAKLRKKFNKPADWNAFDTDIVKVMTNRDLKNQTAINRASLAQATVDLFAQKEKGVGIEKIIGRPRAARKGYRDTLGPLVSSTKAPVYYDYVDQLTKQPVTRRDTLSIPPKATDKQIGKMLKEAGVTRQYVPKEIYDDFHKLISLKSPDIAPDSWIMKSVNAMDDVHNIFRSALTRYFPAFHARNAVSDAFMFHLAPVDHNYPKYISEAIRELPKMDDADLIKYSGLNIIDGSAQSELDRILDSKRASILDRPVNFLTQRAPKVMNAAEKVNEASRATAHFIANVNRYAMFKAAKAKGLGDLEAADVVTKYLFDYNDLTDFERAVPRRAMMFYTFYRKNLPLMLEQVFKNPRLMVNYARATGRTGSSNNTPPWLGDSFFLNEDEKGQQLRMNFGINPEDLNRLDPQGQGLQRVLELAINNLVPAIRMPAEFISGKSFHTGKPTEGGLGERILESLPTSRLTGYGENLLRAVGEDAPPGAIPTELLKFITGVNVKNVNVKDAKKSNEIKAIRNRLGDITRQGGAKRLDIYTQRRGQENPEVDALNKRLGELLNR